MMNVLSILPGYILRSRLAQAALVAATLVVMVAATASVKAAAPDPCTLVTAAEASEILGKPVKTQSAPGTSSGQCLYTPESQVVITFPDVPFGSRPAQIQINSVTVTVATGQTAVDRYKAARARLGRDPEDTEISGLGEVAIVVSNQLYVLQGSSYVQVSPDGVYDFITSDKRFQAVQQKWFDILEAFARPALQRLMAQESTTPAVVAQPQVQTPAAAQPATPSDPKRSPLPGAVVGAAIVGLVGALAVIGLALRKARVAVAPAPVDIQPPTLPPNEVFTPKQPTTPDESEDAPDEPLDPGPTKGLFISAMEALASRPEDSSAKTKPDVQIEQPKLPPQEVFDPPRPRTVERPNPCRDLTEEAQKLLELLQSARDENRAAMQRTLNAFFGPRSNPYNVGYANYMTATKITEAVVKANNETGKVLIDAALFAAGGWGGIFGKGSTAQAIFGKGLTGAESAGHAWGMIGLKVAGKAVDSYVGNKGGTIVSATSKALEGSFSDSATKAVSAPASAIESVVREAILDALGNWMKEGAMAGDLARAREAYAQFFAAASVANTTEGAARELKRQIDRINAELRAIGCPEVPVPEHVFYTFDLTQFGEGMFDWEKGPKMHAKNIVRGTDRTTDLFAVRNDVRQRKDSLPF